MAERMRAVFGGYDKAGKKLTKYVTEEAYDAMFPEFTLPFYTTIAEEGQKPRRLIKKEE